MISANSGIPIHLLPKFVSRISIDEMELIALPLNTYHWFLPELVGKSHVHLAFDELKYRTDENSSEADLWSLSWDIVLAALTNYPDGCFQVRSELEVSRIMKNGTKIDWATLPNSIFIPVLVVEMGN